jgi:hypothetical protein
MEALQEAGGLGRCSFRGHFVALSISWIFREIRVPKHAEILSLEFWPDPAQSEFMPEFRNSGRGKKLD